MFQVVHFTGATLSDFDIVSTHNALSEAQAAHAAIVAPNRVLIADFLDYGILS